MSDRVTMKRLEDMCASINEALNVPTEPYYRDKEGKLTVNAGTVYVAGAYGGVRLEQMCHGGGSRDFLSTGYCSKKELREVMLAWLAGRRTHVLVFTAQGHEFWLDPASGMWKVIPPSEVGKADLYAYARHPSPKAAAKALGIRLNIKWQEGIYS